MLVHDALIALLTLGLLAGCDVYDATLLRRTESANDRSDASDAATIPSTRDADTVDANATDANTTDAITNDALTTDATSDAQTNDAAAHVTDADTPDATKDTGVVDARTADASQPLSCAPMWGDCNDDPRDGCETDLSREPNCGRCNRSCEKLPFLHTCRHADDPATGVCMRPPCQCCNQLQGCN